MLGRCPPACIPVASRRCTPRIACDRPVGRGGGSAAEGERVLRTLDTLRALGALPEYVAEAGVWWARGMHTLHASAAAHATSPSSLLTPHRMRPHLPPFSRHIACDPTSLPPHRGGLRGAVGLALAVAVSTDNSIFDCNLPSHADERFCIPGGERRKHGPQYRAPKVLIPTCRAPKVWIPVWIPVQTP